MGQPSCHIGLTKAISEINHGCLYSPRGQRVIEAGLAQGEWKALVRQDAFQSQLYHDSVAWPSPCASLSLSSLICKMELIILLSQDFCENWKCYVVSDT